MKTLSKLIKECGESFNSLEQVRRDSLPISSMLGDDKDVIWKASCWETSKFGQTPEEAVSKLLQHLKS